MKILMELGISPAKINGVSCIKVTDFARVTNKSPAHISNLILKGNSIRHLKCIRVGTTPFIPVSEVIEYPFVTVGRNGKEYFYTEDGSTTPVEDCK